MNAPIHQATFWETKYQRAEHPWDLGQAAPPLMDFFAERSCTGKLVVLGCGHGHDAIFLAQRGFTVTGVDFAPSAIAAARQFAQQANVILKLLQANIFDLPATYPQQFDVVFEHTCFCAIAPEQRPDYVRVAASILKPQGILYGIFFTHNRDGGPPFGSTPQGIRDLFAPHFDILSLEPIQNSIPSRQGEEHWGIFQKK